MPTCTILFSARPLNESAGSLARPTVIVMTKPRDDWAAYEYASAMVGDIRKRLKAGSEGSGVTLTPDECDLVLGNLRCPSPPNSRPSMNWVEKQQTVAAIARYCFDLEKSMSL